jgi:hypothetical protein
MYSNAAVMRDALTRLATTMVELQDERVAILSPLRWRSRSFLQLPGSIGEGTPAALRRQQLNELAADSEL